MGFYGSKLLGQNTTFKFDRIYPNRKTMEENRHTDGVYIGRYVLIDYGLDDDLKNPTGNDDLKNPTGEVLSEVLSRHFYLNPNSDSIEIYTYPDFEAKNDETGEKIYRLKYANTEDDFYTTIPMQVANNNVSNTYYNKVNGKYVEVFPPFLGNGNVFVLKEPVNTYILKDTIIYVYKVEKYNLISSDKITDGEKVYFWKSKDESGTLGYQIYTGHIPYQDENGNILETGYDNVDFYEGVNPKKIFYYCDGKDDSGYEYATFKELSNSGLSNYSINYNIDLAAYTNNNGGRGYDSTVWQKVFKDGKEYYINIADLNTVIPTFDITVDGPTLEPRPPHFDANSTNVYYNLHTQPSWGFRVKEAERKPLGDSYSRINDTNIYPSDLDVDIIDTNYWEDANDKKQDNEEYPYPKYAGAIYFNKAGFNSEIRSDAVTNEKDNGIDNAIKVTPTGQSGQKYNTHDGIPFDKEIRPDIQELSIMLPGIGNAISELWDLAYGDAEANDNNKENKRNKNIDWNDTSGLRLINKKSQDNNNDNGFTFSTEKVNNLAGCINSVHDLMGMIVQTVNDTKDADKWNNELENADYGKIYYRQSDGNYYIKSPSYKYEELEKDDTDSYVLPQERKFVEVKVSDFKEGEYYLKQNEDYILQDVYTSNTTYYDMSDIEPKELNSRNWEKGVYYYQENNSKDFKKDEAEEISERQKILYDLDNLQYHILYDEQSMPSKTYPVGILDSDWYINRENIKWYIKDPYDENNYIKVEKDDVTTDGITVYEIEIIDEENSEENIKIDGASLGGKIADIKDETYFLVKPYENGYTYYYVDKDGYYYKDDILKTNITLLKDNSDINIWGSHYKIIGLPTVDIKPELDFYEPGIYHYKENDNYYLDYRAEGLVTNENKIDYYLIDDKDKALNKYFYEPNKYYYKDFNSNSYYLDTNDFDKETIYYLESTIHVTSDNDLLLPLYSVWNPNATGIPSGVQLSRKVIESDGPGSFKWTKLEGFSRTLNTIHGLIVRINHLLQFTDNETRENLSVMGCINQMHDIINSFADLIPEQFAVIDNYGRVQSADFDTSQSNTASNNRADDNDLKDITGDKFNEEAPSVNDMKKQWITVNINGNVDEPKVTIHHNFQAVTDKTTESDKNGNPVEGEPGLNNDADRPDDLLLYTPIVDDMGHVVGESIETVTLPYGYKNINGWVANSTQDTLTITDDDKWINVPIKTENNTFKITHEYPNGEVPTLSTEEIDLNNSDEDSFELEIPKFDEKGHIESYGNRKIILPNGFKEVNNIKAKSTKDKLVIEGDNDWINVSNDNPEKILVTHKHPFEGNIPSADTDAIDLNNFNNGSSSFSISLPNFDNTGHIESFSNKDITLPNSFKYIKDKTDSLIEPSSPTETLQITGNDWIDTIVDTANNTIAINHVEKEEIKNYGDEPLIFEGRANTVLMPKITTDKAGHIEVLESQSVTIPGRTVTIKQSKTITRYSYTATEDLIILTDGKYVYYEANLGDRTYYIKFNNVIPAGDTVIIDKGDNGIIVSNQCEIFNAMPSGPNTNFGTLNFISETISGNSLLSSLLSGNNDFEFISGNGIILDYEPPHATGGGGQSRGPHKITISSDGSGLNLETLLTNFDDTNYPLYQPTSDEGSVPDMLVPVLGVEKTHTVHEALAMFNYWMIEHNALIKSLTSRVAELEEQLASN